MWELLTQEEKNNILLKLLIFASKTDGIIHKKEFAYLLYVCRNLNVDPETLRDMSVDFETFKEFLPNTEQDRMQFLYHLLFLMKSDETISIEEEKILYHFGFKLGFLEDKIRDFIHVAKRYTLSQLPSNALLDIVKKYNN